MRAVPYPVWSAVAAAVFALIASLFVHPVALFCLAGPYAIFLIGRHQLPNALDAIWICGTAVALTVGVWAASDWTIVSLLLGVFGMGVGLLALWCPPRIALSVICGAAFALAAASVWMSYPHELLIGVCVGTAMLCLQIHWLETLHNVRLDLEDQVELRTQRIRYLLRERDEVTTLAVHDLQSPIQAVAGMQKTLLHMLEDDKPDKDSMRQALEVAIETNADLSDRIGSLLNTSRDHLGGSVDTTSLARIIDGTIAAHKIDLRGREISIDLGAASHVQLHNQEDIKDIIDVLLDNAIKYAPEDGTIRISAQYDAPRGMVMVDIQDNGSGVPSKARDTLFSAPVDKPTKNARTGLGLYLASRRAARLGGTLSHISPRDVGTIFRVTLPGIHPEAQLMSSRAK